VREDHPFAGLHNVIPLQPETADRRTFATANAARVAAAASAVHEVGDVRDEMRMPEGPFVVAR